MFKPKLSIIIPVYNTEKYLSECLNSVLEQDLPQEEFEVICIYDPSPDKCKDLLYDFSQNYSNISIIEHSTVKSIGESRNDGIKAAIGEYIWFVDSDDRVSPNSLSRLFQLCDEFNPDIIAFNFNRFSNNGDILTRGDYFTDSPISTGFDLIKNTFGINFIYYLLGFSWLYIYKRKLLTDNYLLFPERIHSEDVAFACNALIHSQKVISISDILYHYRYNPNSASSQLTKRVSGRQVFDNVFFSGNLVEQLGHKFNTINQAYAKRIIKYAEDDYYNKLWIMYLPLPLKEKSVFAQLVKRNPEITSDKKRKMTALNRLFVREHIPAFALILAPAYRLAKWIKKTI